MGLHSLGISFVIRSLDRKLDFVLDGLRPSIPLNESKTTDKVWEEAMKELIDWDFYPPCVQKYSIFIWAVSAAVRRPINRKRGPFVISISSVTGWLSTCRILNTQCRIHQRNSNIWTYQLITTQSNWNETVLAGVLPHHSYRPLNTIIKRFLSMSLIFNISKRFPASSVRGPAHRKGRVIRLLMIFSRIITETPRPTEASAYVRGAAWWRCYAKCQERHGQYGCVRWSFHGIASGPWRLFNSFFRTLNKTDCKYGVSKGSEKRKYDKSLGFTSDFSSVLDSTGWPLGKIRVSVGLAAVLLVDNV